MEWEKGKEKKKSTETAQTKGEQMSKRQNNRKRKTDR